jgi:hypothetical protein
MAGKVFFSVSMSLDGFMAPEAVPVEDVFSPEGQNDPRVQRWMTKWSELQAWAFPQRFFRENLKLGEGGEEGLDKDIARATHERTGASVMGKRMFDAGELACCTRRRSPSSWASPVPGWPNPGSRAPDRASSRLDARCGTRCPPFASTS